MRAYANYGHPITTLRKNNNCPWIEIKKLNGLNVIKRFRLVLTILGSRLKEFYDCGKAI